jgi:hypothetical protein
MCIIVKMEVHELREITLLSHGNLFACSWHIII